MIDPQYFLDAAHRAGFSFVTGVPCSLLTSLIDTAIADPATTFVGAANEGDAVAIASGAQLGGRNGIVFCQNSGLGNAVNPLTSLTDTFHIPILLMITWRGEPGEAEDEPQHRLMGAITPRLLELMEIPWEFLPERDGLQAMFARANASMRARGRPYAVIVRRAAFGRGADRTHAPLRTPPALPEPSVAATELCPDDALRAVLAGARESDIVITTTGFTGRALYAIADRPNHFYMVGSMGCASSVGLGLAIVRSERRVIVIDGDGALLMRLGALATIGHERPDNLVHVVLDNGVHDSTGAQATVSRGVDIAAVAAACGYPVTHRITSLESLRAEVAAGGQRLSLLHVHTAPRTDRKLPRPKEQPPEVATRIRDHCKGN